MEKLSICRICLTRDSRLCLILNTHLQHMYECLTSAPLVTEDVRPVQVCDLCFVRLENCCELRRSCLLSEKLFTQLLRCNVQVNLQMMPNSHKSTGAVVQMTPVLLHDDDVKEEAPDDLEDDTEGCCVIKTELEDVTSDDAVVEQDDRTSGWGDSHYVVKEDSDIVDPEPLMFISTAFLKPSFKNSVNVQDALYVLTINDYFFMSPSVYKVLDPDKDNDATTGNAEWEYTISKTELDDIMSTSEKDLLEEDYAIETLNSEDGLNVAAVVTEQGDVTAIADVPKSRRLVAPKTHKETSENQKKGVKTNVKIEQSKSETKRTVKDIPAQNSKIVETRDELYRKYKENINTLDHSDVHKDISESKLCADQSIKSNVSLKLRPYSCDTCQKCFTTKSSLVTHIRSHAGEKPFKCSICKKCFNHKTSLVRHIRTHTREKPFKCSICKKCFNQKHHLAYHIRTHTGEKPFQCSICKKCFIEKSALTTHTHTHTGKKPFRCSICKKCFNHRTNLARHIRTHTGEKPFNCSICKKFFNQKHHLARHIRTHTGEKPFKCSICKKCFSRKSYLKPHSRTHTAHIV